MTDDYWLHALEMDSKSQRARYYTFLRKNELKQKSKRRKQELKQQQRAETAEETLDARVDGLAKNTIFMMVYDSTIKKVSSAKAFFRNCSTDI